MAELIRQKKEALANQILNKIPEPRVGKAFNKEPSHSVIRRKNDMTTHFSVEFKEV